MPSLPFNGLTLEFTPSGGSLTTLKARSHSEAGNTRPDIDITTGADTRRVVTPGLAECEKHTFECVAQTIAERAAIIALLDDCAPGTLEAKVTECGGSPTALIGGTGNAGDAWCTGVTYSGELDGAFIYSVEFTMNHATT